MRGPAVVWCLVAGCTAVSPTPETPVAAPAPVPSAPAESPDPAPAAVPAPPVDAPPTAPVEPDPAELRRQATEALERADAAIDAERDPAPHFRAAIDACTRALAQDGAETAARVLRVHARRRWLDWLEPQRRDDEPARLAAIADCTALLAASDTPLEWRRRRGELRSRQAIRVFWRDAIAWEWFDGALADLDAWMDAHPEDHHTRETAAATRLWLAEAQQRAARDSDAVLERAAADFKVVVDATSGAWAWWQLGRVRQQQARNARVAGRDPRPWCDAAGGCLDAWAIIEPADPDLFYTRAYVARIAGDTDAAVRAYTRWLTLADGRPWRRRWVQGWVKAAQAGPDGRPAPWLAGLDLAWWHNDVGRYDRSCRAFEEALAGMAADGGLEDPDYAELLATARYDLACCQAVLSTGRWNVFVEPTIDTPPAAAAALRAAAMDNLLAAEALAPSSAEELAGDADLAALHDDPRFRALLADRR